MLGMYINKDGSIINVKPVSCSLNAICGFNDVRLHDCDLVINSFYCFKHGLVRFYHHSNYFNGSI